MVRISPSSQLELVPKFWLLMTTEKLLRIFASSEMGIFEDAAPMTAMQAVMFTLTNSRCTQYADMSIG